MKKTVSFLAFLLVTIIVYSQSTIVYNQNFETWSNGVPVNWGGPTSNIAPSGIIQNQYQTNPPNSSAKFFGNATGATKISTPLFAMDETFCYYIYFKYRSNTNSADVGFDTIMNNRTQFSSINNLIESALDSTIWYEGIIRYRPKFTNTNSELVFKLIPGSWLELDDIMIFKSRFQDTLNISNIAAFINSNGNFFNRLDEFLMPGFYFPKNTIKSTMFCSNIWIGGFDVQNQIHLAAQLYPDSPENQASAERDFSFGPVSTDTTLWYNLLYDHVWKVNKSEIDYHIAHYNDPNYIIPLSISQWPAHGRIDLGEMWILAPFVDVDNNNIYNPENGDYPKIRGDQAIFFMMNDQMFTHSSGGDKMGIQINGMAYGYNTPSDLNLYNTIFMHFDIYNRSTFDYHNVYIGTFADFDIGFAEDDYIGSDTIRNMCYGYNGDLVDGQGFPQHYGENPPFQGLVSLNNPIYDFIYFDNNESPRGLPHTVSDYYNYLTRFFKDGTHLQHGGNGHQTGGPECGYMFPGDPTILGGGADFNWTEWNVGNAPYDRRGIMSSGPFTLNAGQNMYYDLAFPVTMTPDNENYNITGLQTMVDSIQNFYNSMNYVVDTTNTQVDDYLNTIDCKVFPNPNNGQFTIQFSELPMNGEIQFFNTLGQLIQVKKIQNSSENFDLKPHTGMIFYTVLSENKMVSRGKMIVR